MRRRLRAAALFLLFGLLPPLSALGALRVWLDDRVAEREDELLAAMSRAVSAAADANLGDHDRLALLRRAVERFAAPDGFTAEGEAAVNREFAAIAPGLARAYGFRRDTVEDRFVPADPATPAVYSLYAGFLRGRDIRWDSDDLTAAEIAAISREILGPRNAPQPIGFRRTLPNPVLHDGREGTLLWDIVGPYNEPAGLAMLFVYEDAYREAFGASALLARETRQLPSGVRSGVHDANPGMPGPSAPPGDDDPEFAARLAASPAALEAFRTARHLVALMPEGRTAGRSLYAFHPRAEVFPERAAVERLARLLAVAYLIGCALLVRAVRTGRMRLFIPLRAQFALLFPLTALLPLAAAWFIGMRTLRAGKAFDEADALRRIRAKLASGAERAADEIRAHERRLQAIHAAPQAKSFDLKWLREAWTGYNRPRFERYRGMADHRSGSEPLNDFYLFDNALKLRDLWWRGTSHPAMQSLMRGIAERLFDAVNGGGGGDLRESGLGDELASTLLSMDSGMIDGLVRRRGRMETVQLFGASSTLLVDALLDGEGRATGAVILIFHDWELERRAAWLETARAGPDAGDGIEILAAQKAKALERYPDGGRFSPDIDRLLASAGQRNGPVSGAVERDGEILIAVAAPVQGFNDFLFVGMMPRERIDAPWRMRARFLNLLVALSLLASLGCAAMVARRFVEPVRRFDRGLIAVADGDYAVRLPAAGDDELADMARTFNRLVEGLDEKARMSRYVSDFVRSAVRTEAGAARGGGERLSATVLFCDIRSFTTLSERHPASEIVRMLNEYLERMTRAIQSSGGVIDRFIGDAVKAVFYPPPDGTRDDAARAVTAALRMRAELAEYNALRRAEGRFEIENGIGIHTGEMIKGTIGTPEVRLDLTVVGREVELAGELEALSKHGRLSRIVLSEPARALAAHLVATEPLDGGSHGPFHEVVGPRRAADYLPLLASASSAERARGISLLSLLEDPSAAGPIRAALEDPAPEVRFAAATALRARRHPDGDDAPALVAALEREPEARVRAALVVALGGRAGDAARASLARGLTDSDPRVRANAVEALAAGDGAVVVPLLLPLLSDSNNRLRANACVALFAHGRFEAVDHLAAMARDDAPLMRASAAWALTEIATMGRRSGSSGGLRLPAVTGELLDRLDAALGTLHDLVADPDPRVVRHAAHGLARTGNRRSLLRIMEAFAAATDPDLRAVLLAALEAAGAGPAARTAGGAPDPAARDGQAGETGVS